MTTIRTDGASLYHERRGSGPALLMISGGGGDAGYYSEVAERLADTYTVLTYDRRGNSRSTVDDPASPLDMAEQTADALAVLRHNDFTSALVFGGSGGALIALDLAARHRTVVEGLIAHEPPVFALMSDVEHDLFAEIAEITRSEGAWPAYVRFIATIDRVDKPGLLHRPLGRRLVGGLARTAVRVAGLGPRSLREMSRVMGNAEYLMSNEVAPFLAHTTDFAALAGIPIVIGVGAESRQYYMARAGEAVAERLGVPVVEFPGKHAGYVASPEVFAVRLREVLAGLRQPA
ncbi:alpha/beta hydrolase [Actinophytocola sp.]|uniref:alpha/beta fold hydrolase n=1 Tax=Actinophytocola sp. TaxID=1872138 RepID=UPI002ED12E39